MLNYIDEVLAPNTVPGQYLLMDQLSSHKTARVVPSLNQLPVESSIFLSYMNEKRTKGC
jgi:hypothetical protein